MRFLFVLPEYSQEPAGGIRTFYVNLLPTLARAGFQVKVLLSRREFSGKNGFVDESGVEVEYVRADLLEKHDRVYQESQFAGNWLMGQFVPVANAAFEQVKGGEGFDFVEVTDWPLLFLPWVAQRQAQVPFTISLHSSVGQMIEYEAKRDSGRMDFALVRMFEALGFAAAQSIHANSDLNAGYWEKITNRKVDVLLPLLNQKGITTKDTNGHEILTTEDTESTTEHRGRCEMEQPKVGPKGEGAGAGATESKAEAGLRLAGQAGVAFSNPSTSKLARDSENTSLTRSAMGPASLPATPRVRGAVFARLQNWKGCEILAEALAECPSIEIHWYGADMGNTAEVGKWSESLARKFSKVFGQNFLYKGVVTPDRVPDLMDQADFVCVPSLWDVFNLSAVEAMESGKVVLCSRQAGAEMLIEDGVNGFLFEPDQPGELAAKLKQILQTSPEERERIGCVARESIREKLHPERLVQQRIAYYQSVAAKKPEENRNCFLPDILELKPSGKKTLGRRLYEFRRKLGI
jgi:glycosyltransferase involved in cell wall biosynthesis